MGTTTTTRTTTTTTRTCLGSTILYKKFQFLFTPYTPQKMTILAKFGHFGTFWYFFDHLYPPKKTKKILYWHNFAILEFFGTFGTFFTPYNPQKKPKNDYFGKIWPFWHFLALFWGGVKIAQKKIMLFKYSSLATQNSKNFYTHCFLIISQIILTGPGLSYQRVLQISCIYCLGQNSKNLLFMIFQD